VFKLSTVALEAMSSAKLSALTKTTSAAAHSTAGSSSSSSRRRSRSAGQLLATQEHVPFTVSLLLTAQKCATALRSACPKLALMVATSVTRSRIRVSASAGPAAWSRSGAAEADLLPSGRRIGFIAEADIVTADPAVTFRPGGMNTNSSDSSSSVSWYTDELMLTVAPWLTVTARSMWLLGQTLSELLPGGSSSNPSSSRTLEQPTYLNLVDAETIQQLLEEAHACVEYLGSQLCRMQLPGDDAAADGSSSIGGGADAGAASMPLLTKLLEQHAQLQTGLYLALQRCAAAEQPAAGQYDINSAGAASLLQRVWGGSLPGQLSAFGAAVTAALPVGWACNNAACTNLAKLSELQLVRGKAKCGGCKLVRLCSAECQRQHWKAGHKLVCKKLAAAAAAAAAATETTPGNGAAGGTSGAGSSGSRSTSKAAAAAAGLELPGSAAAAAALPVRQLKALLSSLSVSGVAGAVEKSDLVGLLVGHLGLG
jgi:hypothetical protein